MKKHLLVIDRASAILNALQKQYGEPIAQFAWIDGKELDIPKDNDERVKLQELFDLNQSLGFLSVDYFFKPGDSRFVDDISFSFCRYNDDLDQKGEGIFEFQITLTKRY